MVCSEDIVQSFREVLQPEDPALDAVSSILGELAFSH